MVRFNLLLALQKHQMQIVPTFNHGKNLPDPLRHSSDKVLSRHHVQSPSGGNDGQKIIYIK
jgi:hypothetical protein